MIKSKLIKNISSARANVQKEISAFSKVPGIYSGGLAREGYNGGYQDALDDVLLLINDCYPCKRKEFWELIK